MVCDHPRVFFGSSGVTMGNTHSQISLLGPHNIIYQKRCTAFRQKRRTLLNRPAKQTLMYYLGKY